MNNLENNQQNLSKEEQIQAMQKLFGSYRDERTREHEQRQRLTDLLSEKLRGEGKREEEIRSMLESLDFDLFDDGEGGLLGL